MDVVYAPPINECHVRLRKAFHFGQDDPLFHPQPFNRPIAHLAIIRTPSPDPNHRLSTAWVRPTSEDFKQRAALDVCEGLGRLSRTLYWRFHAMASEIFERSSSQREDPYISVQSAQLRSLLERLEISTPQINSPSSGPDWTVHAADLAIRSQSVAFESKTRVLAQSSTFYILFTQSIVTKLRTIASFPMDSSIPEYAFSRALETKDFLQDPSLLTRHANPNAPIRLFEGRVGNTYPGNVLVTSPNMDVVYAPPINECHVRLRKAFHFGQDDPLFHPQPFNRPIAHLAIIRTPSPDPNHRLSTAWVRPTSEDFKQRAALDVCEGLGRLSRTLYWRFHAM
ncbi:hypothetical protein PQX77_020440, partial [Marasmius sp. AFHP31]